MKLRWRLTLATATVGAIVAVGGAAGALISTQQQLRAQIDRTLMGRTGDPDHDGRTGVNPGAPKGGGTMPGGRPIDCGGDRRGAPDSAVQLLSSTGTVTSCGNVAALPTDAADLAIAKAGGGPRLRTVSVSGERYRVMTASLRSGVAVQVARNLDETDAVLASLRARLAVLGAIAVAAAAASGWFIARRLVRPVEQLRAATDRIAHTDDLSAPVTVRGTDEIASLASSFNTMIGSLSTSREQQTRLIADASHELRTPLTSLRTNVELLQRARNLTTDQHSEVVGAVVADVDELTALMTELVELASDRSASDEAPQEIELGDIAKDVAERTHRRSRRAIDVVVINPQLLELRPRMIDRAITNLVENAVKYGARRADAADAADEDITITVDGGRVEVRDHGKGIADTDLDHVFNRFYRSISARSAPGSGLGLAIVEQIVNRHGGSVFARNAADGGAIVGFELPVPSASRPSTKS